MPLTAPEPHGGISIAPFLDENFSDIAVLVYGAIAKGFG